MASAFAASSIEALVGTGAGGTLAFSDGSLEPLVVPRSTLLASKIAEGIAGLSPSLAAAATPLLSGTVETAAEDAEEEEHIAKELEYNSLFGAKRWQVQMG